MTNQYENVHPEILKFATYCREQGFDLLDLPQQYAQDNPLSYGDYLMAHFGADDIVDYAEQMGWDISERPDVVIEIASRISRYADAEFGINWETLSHYIKEAFEAASPEVQTLALGGKLKNPYTGEDEEPGEGEEALSPEIVEEIRQAVKNAYKETQE